MKKFTFLIIAGLFSVSIFAQLNWNINNPKLGYDILGDLFFVDDNSGWVLSNKHENNNYKSIVFHTINGGGQWQEQFRQEVLNDERLVRLFFINSQKGWVVGRGGILLRTTNGGQSWNKSYLPINANLASVFFTNENNGWVVGEFDGIFYTKDGGNSWEFTDEGTYDVHSDIFFFNNQVGFAIGLNDEYDKSRLLKTNDGGLTWSINFFFNEADLYSLYFVDDNYGWAVGWDGSIIHTTNGGENWSVQESNVDWWLWEVSFVDQNKGTICGDDGFLYTSDGGNTWTETTISDTEFNSLCFASQNKGYAVGNSTGWEEMGAFYTTIDGGATWENANAKPAYLKKVCAIDENTLITVGGDYHYNEYPSLLKTSDMGSSWTYQELGGDWYSPLEDVCFNSGTGYAINSYGYIIKSTDLGNTWQEVTQVYWLNDFSSVSLFFTNSNKGYICGENSNGDGRGVIYYTSNGGSTWTQQIDGEFNAMHGIQFVGENKGWAVTERDYENGNWIPGQILFTNNGGNLWTPQNPPGDNSYFDLYFLNDQLGWVCGTVILNTIDGGNTWNLQLDQEGTLNGISFIDENHGYAVGDAGVIYRTSDGGQNWILEEKLTGRDLNDVCYVNADHAWAVGYDGLILHAYGGTLSIHESETNINLAKVFPNPGTGKYTIELATQHYGQFVVTLRDLNGQLLMERILDTRNSYLRFPIDISNQPNGLYILQINSSGYQETAKVLKY